MPDDSVAAIESDVAASAVRIVALLRARGLTLAVAESLTGGLLAAAITAVPGSSAIFRGGVVAYATDLKQQLLGVDGGLLARVGAVHGEVAEQMASGARLRLGADIGVATTGVAGPDPQDGQLPGTVWVGLCTGERTWHLDASLPVPLLPVPGGGGAAESLRAMIRVASVRAALAELHGAMGA